MGNRPINRRPWRRRPRIKRAVQWFDGLSAGSFDRESGDEPFTLPCIIPQLPIICDSFADEGDARSHVRTVWAGPTDAAHLDSSNALIERIVGSIEVRAFVDTNPAPFILPLVRFGLLAVEEVPPGDAAELQQISLFQNEHIQRYEWMWLHQCALVSQNTTVTDAVYGLANVELDVRVRRSLGKQDAVFLYASFVTPVASDVEPSPTTVWAYPLLRVLHSTR